MQTITKPQVLAQPFCSSGDKNVIPNNATGTNRASLQEGFPEITGKPLKDGGIPPERRDFNGLLNMDSQFYYAFQNGWRPTFDQDVSDAIGGYALGAVLWSDAGNYFVKSLKANNTDNFVSDPSKIDGVSWQILTAGEFRLPLLSFAWYDHQLNDQSFLRADTFSWQSGATYTSVYNHLLEDIDGKASQTETIGSYTITYYLADDGHKICLADQETTAQNIFNESGVAWYYLLDTANVRFKLPRTKYAFVGLRDNVGKYVAESLPNISGTQSGLAWLSGKVGQAGTGVFQGSTGVGGEGANTFDATNSAQVVFNASLSSPVYQDNAPVQQRATQMYLYFYVGNFSQSATEQTAGLNSELFNGKVDLDGSNATFPHIVETYDDGQGNGYILWSNKWCKQYGFIAKPATNTTITVNFTKEFADNTYRYQDSLLLYSSQSITWNIEHGPCALTAKTTTYFTRSIGNGADYFWQAEGYIS